MMSAINGPSSPNAQLRNWSNLGGEQTATVAAGETLFDVANRLGVDPKALAAANPQITDPANLKAGQQVFLPTLASQESGPTQGATSPVDGSAPSSTATLPSAPMGDPLASVLAQGALGGPSSTQSPGSTPTTGSKASLLTADDLQNLPPQSPADSVDASAKPTLNLVGWSVTLSSADHQRASQIVGSLDGATSFLQSLLAPYFSLQTDGEVREDTGASSKLRADTIQALQNEMLLTSVRLAQTVSPGFSALNVSGEDSVRSMAENWKDDTTQNLDDVLKHAMAAARMMKSREHAKGQLEEISAKLSALISRATVALANALAELHHDPKNHKDHKSAA